MTPNDAQIDVLLRRHAGQARSVHATEHLDADELNAFAEGSLPDAARSRYVSHLADCDDCRKVASQLAITSGAVIAAEAVKPADSQSSSWWKSLSGFFSPLRLRYAALAMVVIVVAGIAFLVYRRPLPESGLVARNERTKPAPLSEVKPTNEGSAQSARTESKQVLADRPVPTAQPSQSSEESSLKSDQSKLSDATSPPPKPAKEAETASNPAWAYKKAAEPGAVSPSYAPPPPTETQRAESRSREQQNIGGVTTMSGPRKSEQAADRAQAPATIAGRTGEGKDIGAEDDNKRATLNQAPASRNAGDAKAKGPRRDLDNMAANNRNSNEVRGNATKAQSVADENREKAKEESAKDKEPETRSVGGRKFKRQGNSWVDSKFKSSMTLKSISRGSSEFDALDSGLRSIAGQISGEIIVVWKSKAYVIR